MPTKLESFRSKYPQYNEVDDETLSGKLYDKYYSEKMDLPTFQKKMGIEKAPPAIKTQSDYLDDSISKKILSDDLADDDDDFSSLRSHRELDPAKWEYPEEASGDMNNNLRNLAERGSNLFGHAVRGIVGRPGDWMQERFPGNRLVFGSDWGKEDPADGKFRVRVMGQDEFEELQLKQRDVTEDMFLEGVPDFYIDRSFGGEARHTPEKVTEAFNNGEIGGTISAVFNFGLEQGIQSVPDMLAVMNPFGLAAYVGARSDEIGETRAENKGLEEMTMTEQVEAIPAALGSALFEKYGADKVFGMFGKAGADEVGADIIQEGFKAWAKRTGTRTGTAAAAEGGTEFFQEGVIEYLGEKMGTDAPMSWQEGAERGFWGALGGATAGGTIGGVSSLSVDAVQATQSLQQEKVPPFVEDFHEDKLRNRNPDEPQASDSAEVESESGALSDPEPAPAREYFDPRLKRDVFRHNLARMADELVEGGDISYVRDENDVITGRTPSVNPEWFQAMGDSDASLSVKQLKKAAVKSMSGESLGVREARAVEYILNEITDQRTDPSVINFAQNQLDTARADRRDAQRQAAIELDAVLDPDLNEEAAGELFLEEDYLPEMDGQARIVDELAFELDKWGLSEEVDILLNTVADTKDAIVQLEKLRYQNKGKASEQTTSESSTEGASTAQATQQNADVSQSVDRRTQTDPLADTATDERTGERRQDLGRRDRVEGMTMDQIVDELYTNPLSGLANERAFNEDIKTAKAVASIDADGLGGVNDHLGHDAGDAMLKAVGEALRETGARVYHKSGDEFYILGETEQDVAIAARNVTESLKRQVLETSKGKLQGIHITSGVGATKNASDTAMESSKKVRESQGKRSRKGQLPPGGVLYSKTGLQMGPGTNYAGIIGKHQALPLTPDNEYQLGNGKTVRIPKKPIRRDHIMRKLEQHFGMKIYQGRIKGDTKLGFYRSRGGEVRIKNANDIEVTAHEIAHWLDDRYPWMKKLYKQFPKEMAGISYDSEKDFEGFAEFMRHWMTQEHIARKAAPGFYDAWMKEMSKRPEVGDAAFEIQELMHGWHLQGARKRLVDRIASKIPLIDRFRRATDKLSDRTLQSNFDQIRSFKQAERDITGKQQNVDNGGSYALLRLARGSHGVMEAVFERGTIGMKDDANVEFTGKGLKKIFDPVSDRMEDMQLYMIARRAEELMGQGRENLIRPDEIAHGLALAKKDPQLETVFEEWLGFSSRMMDFYQDSGIVSEESRTAMEEMNKSYVPFNRVVDSALGESSKKGKGGNPFIRLKGGTHNINDVFENIINNTSHLVQMSLTNQGKRAFYEMIQNDTTQAASNWAVPIQTEVKPTQVQKDQVIRSVMDAAGLDMAWYRMGETGMFESDTQQAQFEMLKEMAENLEPMVTFFQVGQDPTGDVDFYMDNGKKKFFEIGDKLLWESIQALGPRPTNLALSILGGFSATLRRGVTLTPTFQAKNFIRDTMNAFTLSKGHAVPAAGAMKALTERMYNDEHYWEYMANGGGFASMVDASGIDRDRVIDTRYKILKKADGALSAFEYANRIAEFKKLREKGWSGRDAALAGREISSDFAMRGSSEVLRWLTTSVPFLNARMQGLYRNGRELAGMENGKVNFAGKQAFSYAMRSLMAITIPSLWLYMMNKDDERYQEMPDHVKDLSWVFFTGEGEDEYVMMPKPFETGMLWGTLPERMMEYHYTNNESELADAVLFMTMSTFSMNIVPQAYKPWDELKKNKNFTGAPIIPEYLKAVEPMEQYRNYTSDAMIALGRKLNISPIKAEHITRGYFGTLGTWSLGMADNLVGDVNNSGEKPTKGIKDNILLAPFVDAGPLRRTHSENHIYEMLHETRTVVNTVRSISGRSPERIEGYVSQPKKQVLLGLNKVLENTAKSMRQINNAMDQVKSDPNLSGDEKQLQIYELRRAKNEITREVYQNINPEVVDQLIAEVEAENPQN